MTTRQGNSLVEAPIPPTIRVALFLVLELPVLESESLHLVASSSNLESLFALAQTFPSCIYTIDNRNL